MNHAHGGWQRRNSMALHHEENKVPLRQSPKCKRIIVRVVDRNNEGQCDRFVKAEKSEEWMARSPVWPDDVIASETASRHQPMNWRDSIWVQDSVTRRRSRSSQRSVELPMKEKQEFSRGYLKPRGTQNTLRPDHSESIFVLNNLFKITTVLFCALHSPVTYIYIFATMLLI